MPDIKSPNYPWIYTYDYAPDSVWEPWKYDVYKDGGLDENKVPLWIFEEADRVQKRVKDGLPSWILLSDSHFVINGTWEDTYFSMREVSKRIRLQGIIHLGDLTDGLLPLSKTKEFENRCIDDLKSICDNLYIAAGNHDYNYFRGNTQIRYPSKPQYYADLPKESLRLFFIDSFDPKEQYRYGFSDYCIHYLEAALDMMPEGYAAVIFSHVPPLVRLQAWTDNIRNREKMMGVLNAHADKILAFINGHNHCDHIYNELYNGKFPVISINCAKCEYFTEHKPEGAVVPPRNLGDRTQESFDVMQIDAKIREIYFTRFGAGEDRAVKGGKGIWIEH